jgi:hypothetical protein
MANPMKWKTYPMGAACSERMERRGLVAHLDHAVNLDTGKTLCGVKTNSLCMDDSLATNDLPDCPRCRAKIVEKTP